MKKVFKIIILLLVLISIILSTMVVISVKKYYDINRLCTLINANKTNEAKEMIGKIKNVNSFTAPLWLRKIYNMNEYDISTPLIIACEKGNVDIVEALLDKGADPNLSLDGGWAPLEVLYARKSDNRIVIAKMLINTGVQVDLFRSYKSALFIEAESCIYKTTFSEDERNFLTESIVLLLENGASPINENGDTIIHYLAYGGQTKTIELLASDYGYLFEKENLKGETPLDWAKENGKYSEELEKLCKTHVTVRNH